MQPTTHVLYVAHPVAGEVNANVSRAMRWMRWLQRQFPDVTFIAPWIVNILAGEDDSDPAQRAEGIRHSCAAALRCDGIVLCGGRRSDGMVLEAGVVQKAGGAVVDLTELGDEPPIVLEELIGSRLKDALDPERRSLLSSLALGEVRRG